MKKGGGHAKGSAAERKVAVMLSIWWYGKKGYLWRRPGSEVRKYEKNPHSGDIVPTLASHGQYPKWMFHVEVKSWKRGKLKIYHILDKTHQSPVLRIWKKAERKKRKDLKSMLVLRENAHDWLVFMSRSTFDFYFGNTATTSLIFADLGPFISFHDVIGIPWKTMAKLRYGEA